MHTHEKSRAELVPEKHKNLPIRILRAFNNAKHLNGLKRGVRDTLAELCRFIPQNRPFETVFAHKATIAERIGASERTIYRHLNVLIENHLIEIQAQDRKARNGRYSVARIKLTRYAAQLLGFIEAEEGAQPPQMAFDNPMTIEQKATRIEPPHEAESTVIHNTPSDKMSLRHLITKPTNPKDQLPSRTINGLPQDLAWITSLGISRAGVFKLMGKAKKQGKLLSDIVIVVKEFIQNLRAGGLYAYLLRLINGPTDFSVAAVQERQKQEQARLAKIQQQKATWFKMRFSNTTLTNPEQDRLFVLDDKARFAQVYGNGAVRTVPLNNLSDWIARIECGKLILATLAVEKRLRIKC